MRGEYAYFVRGQEFARERFSIVVKSNGGSIIRARVDGLSIGLTMTMEMLCLASGSPQQVALSCDYRGLHGTASYVFSDEGIAASVRSGGVERHLNARPGESCVAVPHPICAYRQFAKLTDKGETGVTICWIDVYDEKAFLRPRLRRVNVICSKHAGAQTLPAGVFNNLTRICLTDNALLYTASGEGYLEQRGLPVLWHQQDSDTSYVLINLSE